MKNGMEKMNNKNGFTLVEILVAMAIASIVMAAIFVTHQAQVQGKITQEVTLEMQQGGRAAIDLMTRELRMAGCDPRGTADSGFVAATTGEIHFTMDIRGGGTTGNEPDGDTLDAFEEVRYAINGNGALGRETGGAGGLQPVLRNVDALDFVYLDANGAVTTILADIRSVQISLVVRSGDVRNRGMLRAHTDTNVYVNLQGDEILDAQNDDFRRIQFNTTVNCRNMGRWDF